MGEQRHPRRHRARYWLPDLLVLVLLATAAVQTQYDVAGRLGWHGPDPRTQPSEVAPPPGLKIAEQGEAPPVAPAVQAHPPDPAKVRGAVAPYAFDKHLGKHVALLVAGLDGKVVYRRGNTVMTPASTMKLLTSAAALDALGPMTRFSTDVRRVPGTAQVVLVGGGDPFLASTRKAARGLYPSRATTAMLAARTAAALHRAGLRTVHLRFDDSLFTGPAFDPAWPPGYRPDAVVPPIHALWVDEGRDPSRYGYLDDPAAGAASLFRDQLRRNGIKVPGPVVRRKAPPGAPTLATVRSAPLGEIVQRTLSVSDNNAAEVLARHVGLAERHQGSFTGGATAVLGVLKRLGVSTAGARVYDGSGLSRHDRLAPKTLLDVLRLAAGPGHADLRNVVAGLPVAGYTGSLKYRYDTGAAAGRGRVRAKTGTLTGVSALAGVATGTDGTPMVFTVMADRFKLPQTLEVRALMDRITAALGACPCGATP